MNFDILFVDNTAYKHYDPMVLECEPLGGTEATVVRVAEELGSRGLKVGVLNAHTRDVTMGQHAYYLNHSYASQIKPEILVSIRGTAAMNDFPTATKYSWHHDMPDQRIKTMQTELVANEATVITVSEFHKTEMQRWLHDEDWDKSPKVVRIYNPVDPKIDVPAKTKVKYDKNVMVWAASPHKGLEKAIEQFKILKNFMPKMELHVFNPGYFTHELLKTEGVVNYGAVPCGQLWQYMSEALCVFYPTNYLETFGLIAAEANAVHCPVATMRIGGLIETVQTTDQFVDSNGYPALLKKVESWHNGDRPEVCIQPRFRIKEIGDQWVKLLYNKKQ